MLKPADWKAEVSKNFAGVRWPAGSAGLWVVVGRWRTKPAKARLLVAWVMATGAPDCMEQMALMDEPPKNRLGSAVEAKRWLRPAGSCQVPLAARTLGTSPVEESRSSQGR